MGVGEKDVIRQHPACEAASSAARAVHPEVHCRPLRSWLILAAENCAASPDLRRQTCSQPYDFLFLTFLRAVQEPVQTKRFSSKFFEFFSPWYLCGSLPLFSCEGSWAESRLSSVSRRLHLFHEFRPSLHLPCVVTKQRSSARRNAGCNLWKSPFFEY
jgi:hypothetical protein